MLCFSGGSTPFTGVSCRHAQILLKIFPFIAKANFCNIDLWTIQFATHCDFPSLDTTGRLITKLSIGRIQTPSLILYASDDTTWGPPSWLQEDVIHTWANGGKSSAKCKICILLDKR